MTPQSENSTSVLELKNVTKTYPGDTVPAVDQLSFSLSEGEILAILGPSGCGKTTTLRLIAGFESPDDGEVLLRGQSVSSKKRMVPPEKRGVTMVFQDYALFPHLTVAKNLTFGLKDRDPDTRKLLLEETLRLIDMQEFAHRYPHQLSGGQQQRVALGRALAPDPVVIMLDEPFSNLDTDMRDQMRREVHNILRQQEATSILVTHDHEDALSFADNVAILNRGRLEQIGSSEELYHRPATPFVATFVCHASVIPARLEGEEVITEAGRFPYLGNHQLPSEVLAMVNPDDIHIQPSEAGVGRIIEREFKGSQNLYTIRVASGATVRSTQPSGAVYPVGTKVELIPTTTAPMAVFPVNQSSPHHGDE